MRLAREDPSTELGELLFEQDGANARIGDQSEVLKRGLQALPFSSLRGAEDEVDGDDEGVEVVEVGTVEQRSNSLSGGYVTRRCVSVSADVGVRSHWFATIPAFPVDAVVSNDAHLRAVLGVVAPPFVL
jgi:hypothetical protein